MSTARLNPDREFLRALHQLGETGVPGLCSAMGVTATAVRQRLSRLEAVGHVERRAVHEGRGRPHFLYRVTDAGLRQLGDNYAELTRLLWDVLTGLDDVQLREQVLGRLRRRMVDHYGREVSGPSVSERLGQLRTLLSDRGFDVELREPAGDGSALPILRENNCPYHDLASQDSTICELERSVFSEVLGTEMELSRCCQHGDACCEFEVAGAGVS